MRIAINHLAATPYLAIRPLLTTRAAANDNDGNIDAIQKFSVGRR